ncbi:MAG TPA: sulfotransferase domain-containing protein [Rhabdochlamydiaceae bacterium]|nr:sulfotransferase domain-containing protein [Rhabdochlamydiaceae bacterium]
MRSYLLILFIAALSNLAHCDPDPQPPSELLEQKIVFVSIPKSGTHLFRKALRLITGGLSVNWIAINSVYRFDPYKNLGIAKPITGAHLFPEIDLIRTECSDKYKKILIIRDPRDVMVSFMYHLQSQKIWAGRENYDFEKFEKLPLDKRLRETLLYPAVLRNPKTCFQYAAKWMREPGVLVCRFEDLVGAKGGGSSKQQLKILKEIAQFLGYGLSEKEIKAIGDQLFGDTWTFRKGKIGAWKTHYNKENKELFKKLMGQSVIDLGYAKDDQW